MLNHSELKSLNRLSSQTASWIAKAIRGKQRKALSSASDTYGYSTTYTFRLDDLDILPMIYTSIAYMSSDSGYLTLFHTKHCIHSLRAARVSVHQSGSPASFVVETVAARSFPASQSDVCTRSYVKQRLDWREAVKRHVC